MSSCRETLSRFLGKVQKYDSALRSGASSRRLKNALLKIRLTLSTGKEIERLQGQLYGHAIALNIILAKVHGYVQDLLPNIASAKQSRDMSTFAHESQNTMLRRIECRLDQQEGDQDQKKIIILAVLSL